MKTQKLSRKIKDVCIALRGNGIRRVKTNVLIRAFRRKYPNTWNRLVQRYGPGGKGCGHRSSAVVQFALTVSRIGYHRTRARAPASWGNPWITVWIL